MDDFIGVILGFMIAGILGVFGWLESDQHISPTEFSFYDKSCLKAASTTKLMSVDIDDVLLKCNNGAVFEFKRKDFKGGVE